MENGETTSQAAQRETIEESGAHIKLHELFTLISVPHVDQVHLFYRATLLDLNYKAGPESLEVKLFTESEVPWDEIAFPTISRTLKTYFSTLKADYTSATAGVYSYDMWKPLPAELQT